MAQTFSPTKCVYAGVPFIAKFR